MKTLISTYFSLDFQPNVKKIEISQIMNFVEKDIFLFAIFLFWRNFCINCKRYSLYFPGKYKNYSKNKSIAIYNI